MIGFPVTREALDVNGGTVARTIFQNLQFAVYIKNFLDSITEVEGQDGLMAAPWNYTADEAYALRQAWNDIAYLKGGLDASATAKKLIGLGV